MQTGLPALLHQQCSQILDTSIREVRFVGGGDINEARLLDTPKGKFFLKMNTSPLAARMFETEAKGLDLLARADVVKIPAIIATGEAGGTAFLLLEFIETGYRVPGFWEEFGAALAQLHRQTQDHFGLDHDNFIGSLPQSNSAKNTWSAFFISQRLQPQLALARAANLLQYADFKSFEKLFQQLPEHFPEEPPALVHGDLWSGNFMVSADGRPVLVDPSVSYSHREMDLAMSHLFGGFDRPFYRSYEEAWPLAHGFEERLPLYQLYYLMVHVNLFGGGYVGSVRKILEQFV